tara:strand:+ start:2255 stop:2557 length:303 start_codon:yes stop_codon:yes gene_type:complete
MKQKALEQALAVIKLYVKNNPGIKLGKVSDVLKELKEYPESTLRSIIRDFKPKPEIVTSKKVVPPSNTPPPKLKVVPTKKKKRGGMIGGNELVSSLYDKV